jgi:hypothetical protein
MLASAIAFQVDVVNASPPGATQPGIVPGVVKGQATWTFFLSGFALCRRSLLAATRFNQNMEGVIYEDYELGVRLRLAGTHVLAIHGLEIVNPGTPTGGFRSENIPGKQGLRSKVSPSLAVHYALYDMLSPEMKTGFKTDHLINALVHTPFWNWPSALLHRHRQWRAAKLWYQRHILAKQD